MWLIGVLQDKYPISNIPEVTGWVNKVEKYKNGSTKISVKLDIDGLVYHNIPLKYVTKVDMLNRMYSEPYKKRKCCENIIKKEITKNYIDNDVHENIDPKLQKMSKIQ